MPRTEIALHGLHHVHRGRRIPVEFQDQGREECVRMLTQAVDIFRRSGLPDPLGMTPPGWDVPDGLGAGMIDVGLGYVASARDIDTPVSPDAQSNASGLRGVSLIHPQLIRGGRLVHIPTNFQATSPIDRALEIIEHGGLLSIKAHIVKTAFGYVASDGLDLLYRNYLDVLFSELRSRYAESIWWATMAEIAAGVRAVADVSVD
jgi:hypothetical protein